MAYLLWATRRAKRGLRDKTGRPLRSGDWGRVVGMPDLSSLSPRARRQTAIERSAASTVTV